VDLALAFAEPTPRTLQPPAARLGTITAVVFGPAGEQLAVANSGGSVELWDPNALQPTLTLARLNAPALHLAYSPSGTLLASAHQDRALRLWDTASGQLLVTLTGHTDEVTSLAFSPDGRRLASSSWDGTVRLWGVE
jgi:WD40 repeat protein